MKEDLKPKLTFPLPEKIYALELFENFIAAGLKSAVALIQFVFNDTDGSVHLEPIHKVYHESRIHCLSWSASSMSLPSPILHLATGSADHNVRLISVDLTQGPRDSVKILSGHRDYVNSVVFQPEDGAQVASGSDDHTVILWETIKGTQLRRVTFRSPVMSLSWHPDEVSKLMIGEKNGVVHIFNIVSYHPIMSFDCGPGPLNSIDWNLANSVIVTVAVRSEAIVWDLSKMEQVSKTFHRQDLVRHIRSTPFSEYFFATCSLPSHTTQINNSKNSHTLQLMSGLPVGALAWHQKRHILVVAHDQKISVFLLPAAKLQI